MPTFVYIRRCAIAYLLCLLSLIAHSSGIGEVIFAINVGGESHTDINGIKYSADNSKNGIASDYGKSLLIQRVVSQDHVLYQTERYDTKTFGYNFPVKQDGDYVLILKFCEVWFTAPNQKVFDVMLNGEHTVVESLDIFSKVGRGAAHDEYIPFTIKNNKLKVQGETSRFDGKVNVEFIKGERDNPKINAIAVLKGALEDVPKLPPMPGTEKRAAPEPEPVEEEEEETDDDSRKPPKTRRPPSGPKVQDPYAKDDTSSMMLPVFIAIGAFIPLLFCLCKL